MSQRVINGLYLRHIKIASLFSTQHIYIKNSCYMITTVFVDTRLSKRKHPRKRFQNFRQSCVLSRSEGHTSGCDWWISIRSVDNMHDWRKFWKRFHACFVFESRVSTKTVVKGINCNKPLFPKTLFPFSQIPRPEHILIYLYIKTTFKRCMIKRIKLSLFIIEIYLLWNSQNREHQKYLWNVIMWR